METRMYPIDCTSAFCGNCNCPSDCKYKSALDEFKAWRERTKAIQPDPIWNPSFWKATVQNPT